MGLDKDIVEGFTEESNELLERLEEIVEELEDADEESPFPALLLQEFAQKVDRIMGAAQTLGIEAPNHLGLQQIARVSQLCKHLGYAAVKAQDRNLLPLFAGFWADSVEVLQSLIRFLEDETKSAEVIQTFSSHVQKRLEWLSKKMGAEGNVTTPDEIAKLLKSLGTL